MPRGSNPQAGKTGAGYVLPIWSRTVLLRGRILRGGLDECERDYIFQLSVSFMN